MIAQSSGGGGGAGLLLFPLLLVGVFYFLLIRPQQRRMRAQRELIESLDVGDEILTIGGLFGTIRSQDDEALTVEIAPGTTVRLLRSAVARRLTEEPADEDLPEDEDEEASGG